jgi:hypothetical protein
MIWEFPIMFHAIDAKARNLFAGQSLTFMRCLSPSDSLVFQSIHEQETYHDSKTYS